MPKLPVTLDTQGQGTSQEQRRVVLAEFEHSGMSGAQFVRRAGLKYSTFAAWVQRYRRTKGPGRASPVRLVEAVVASAPLSSALPVRLPGGTRLEISDVSQVAMAAALVRALE